MRNWLPRTFCEIANNLICTYVLCFDEIRYGHIYVPCLSSTTSNDSIDGIYAKSHKISKKTK